MLYLNYAAVKSIIYIYIYIIYIYISRMFLFLHLKEMLVKVHNNRIRHILPYYGKSGEEVVVKEEEEVKLL